MKKTIRMIAMLVLALSLAAGASADKVTAKAVLTFEKFEVDTTLTRDADGAYDDTYAWEDNQEKDVGKWSATVTADGGQSGQALSLTSMKGEKEHFLFVKLTEDENVTNWTGGTDLYFYVDATGWEEPQLAIRLVYTEGDNDIQYVFRSNRSNDAVDKTNIAYIQDQDGNFVEVPSAKWTRAILPANYKGWVKVPLNDASFMPQWWGDYKNKKLDVSNITAIGMHVESDVDKDKTLMVDSFAVAGLEGGNLTIADDISANSAKDQTNGGNTNKTTNKGATTGEAGIPALLLVALPVSAGVVLACKKRSK